MFQASSAPLKLVAAIFCLLGFLIVSFKSPAQAFYKGDEEVLELNGEWEFYWDTLLNPQQILITSLRPESIKVPSSWTEYGYEADGKATYRLLLEISDEPGQMALFVPKIWSNSKVWVNGKLVSERGDIRMMDSRKNKILETLTTPLDHNGRWDIVVQVSNKDIYLGGLLYPFKAGSFSALSNEKKSREAIQTVWLGALIIMGFYHLILFLIGRANLVYLLISCIAFLLALKMLVFGENVVYQWLKETDALDFKWQSSLYYLSTYMVAGLGCIYIHKLYPNVGQSKIGLVFFCVISAYGIFILFSPLSVYTPTLLPFQLFVGLAVLYVIVMMLLGVRVNKSITTNTLQLVGISVMILAAMNDGLYEYGLKTGLPQEILPYSFIVVIFLQMIILAHERYQDHQKILELVDTLEDTVKRRTRIIHDQKEELEGKTHELATVNNLKDKYFTNVSHDLRSPLSLLLGNLEFIKQAAVDRLPESSLKHFEKAEVAVEVLKQLIEQITTLILIKSNGLELDLKSGDLVPLVNEQISTHEFKLNSKGIRFELESDESVIAMIDNSQFFRVIQNLLSNAIEYTPENGSIIIRLWQRNDEAIMQFLNSGKLIDPEIRTRIFERFYSSRSGRGQGMGIGLELTRELVELHGGTIEVSVENDMNCFEVALPKDR